MLDRADDKRKAQRERKQRQRERERTGIEPVTFEADYNQLVLALLEAEMLCEADSLDRAKVSAAVAMVMAEWCRRWTVTA